MNKLLKSYLSFTRTERAGLVCLCSLLVLLIAVRASMGWWAQPATHAEKDKRLAATWANFKSKATTRNDNAEAPTFYKPATDGSNAALPDVINLNTADSATLTRMRGIGPATARKIVARRLKKGPYTDLEQLKEVGSFSVPVFELLKKHLSVSSR